jgi:hypothetical protein
MCHRADQPRVEESFAGRRRQRESEREYVRFFVRTVPLFGFNLDNRELDLAGGFATLARIKS